VTVPTVDAAQVTDEAYLLDVREPDEWAAGHPPGAHHVR
jgi:rhodanese-related sulfurtransferase